MRMKRSAFFPPVRFFAVFAAAAALVWACIAAAQTTTISLSGVLAENSTMYYIPEQNVLPYGRYLTENSPPLVHEVKVAPDAPGPNDEITITAEIGTDPELTENKMLSASVHYSPDGGGTWEEVEMEQSADDPDLWTAALPPMEEAGRVPFFFTAQDDAGNYLAELPSVEIEWGAKERPELLAVIPDKDDDRRLVEDDLDILETGVGFDGAILYFGFRVQGEISSGTVTPFEPFIYSIGIFLPERLGEEKLRPDYVFNHAQHAQFVHFPVIGLLDVEKNFSEVAAADPRYYYDDEWLFLRMKQDALKSKEFERLKIIFGTAKAISYAEIGIKTLDVTGFVNIVRSERFIEIE